MSILSSFLLCASPQFACCGVNGPEDFEAIPHLPHSSSEKAIPEACCQRELQSQEGMFINKEECLKGNERFQNRQVREAERQEKELHSGQRDGCSGHGCSQ